MICTTSDAGLGNNIGQANYGTAKAGIATFAQIAAKELERYDVRVNTVAPGALTQLAAGVPGKRATLPHARVVLHQPAGQSRGPIPDLILQADEIVRVRSEIERILSEATGHPVETLRADTDHDRVFDAEAARAYGLVDHVIERRSARALAS